MFMCNVLNAQPTIIFSGSASAPTQLTIYDVINTLNVNGIVLGDEFIAQIHTDVTSLTTVDNIGVFEANEGDARIKYLIEVLPAPNVINIEEFSFVECSSLVSVSFPNITSIEDYVFYYCISLENVSFPNVTSIGKYAFCGCKSIISYNFPSLTNVASTSLDAGDVIVIDAADTVLGVTLQSVSIGTAFDSTTTIVSEEDDGIFGCSGGINVVSYLFKNSTDLILGANVLPLPDTINNTWLGYTWKSIIIYTGIKENSIATYFTISPNPTSVDAVISFGLLESGNIALEVCDLLGNILYTVNIFYDVGEHSVTLDTKAIPNGSYICRMLAKGKQIGTTNFVIVK